MRQLIEFHHLRQSSERQVPQRDVQAAGPRESRDRKGANRSGFRRQFAALNRRSRTGGLQARF